MHTFKKTALALAAAGLAGTAIPASAVDIAQRSPGHRAAPQEETWERNRRGDRRDRRNDQRYAASYAEPVYRNTQVWRGQDGRTYCRKKDGTTGLIIGGAAGALLGREIDKTGSRTVGTILGAAAGALIGRELTNGVSCR